MTEAGDIGWNKAEPSPTCFDGNPRGRYFGFGDSVDDDLWRGMLSILARSWSMRLSMPSSLDSKADAVFSP